ncbi:MAG: DUF285 domain-containing protein, partial [Fibrobacter sp.]|nr:DUF285 domain-containing protein [Fibrobacter sp.]
MWGMFANTAVFNQDISGWDVSQVKDMNRMFRNSQAFDQNIGGWDVGNVTNMREMFYGAQAFNQNVDNWDVSNVSTMSNMFANTAVFNQDISGWDVSNVTTMSRMFMNSQAFDQDLSAWDISKVKYMDSIFIDMTLSTANYDSILCNWSQLELQRNVKFDGGNSKYSPGLPAASRALLENVYNWQITDGGSLEIDNAPLILVFDTELSPGNTISLALNDYVDAIVDWGDGNIDTVKTPGIIEYDYAQPGQYTVSIAGTVITFGDEDQTTPNIEKLVEVKSFGDVGLFILSRAFNDAINLRKVPDTLPASIKRLDYAFTGATSFDQDLSSWDISNVVFMDDMFAGTALSTPNYNRILEQWSALPVQNGVEFSVGTTMYSPGTPATARQKLEYDFGWDITDGGISDLPAITAATVVELTASAASLSAELTHNGGSAVTDRGLVWATTPQPILGQDSVIAAGSELGEFSASITNLSCAQPYYVRSYATNDAGTAYGTEISFVLPCELTIAGNFIASDKSYDGNSNATIKTNNLELQGAVSSHQVELSDVVLEFAQSKAGKDLKISIKSAKLSGADKGNYTLSMTGAPTAKANISAKEITIAGSFSAKDKAYDGKSTATINSNKLKLEGVI